MTHTTDLIATIDAIIRRERIPDRAGAAIVEALTSEYALVPIAERDLMVQALWLWGKYNPKANERCDAIVDLLFADLDRDAPGGEGRGKR